MDATSTPPPTALSGATILQIVPSLETGGAERTAVDIAAALVGAGARALVASRGGRLIGELEAAGGEWIPFPAETKNPLRILLNSGGLGRVIRDERVALVHARSRAPAWSALMAARRHRIPFVTTYHGAYRTRGPLKTWYNSAMARGDAVIANSRFTADWVAGHHPEAEPRIAIIYRGIDVGAYSDSAVSPDRIRTLRRAWGVAETRRIVLLPGRMSGVKGHEVLIDAAARLAAAGHDDVDFVLAGDTEYREDHVGRLVDRILRLGLGHRVRLVGHCDDMPAANMLADVAVAPSTVPETFGRTAVEAQAAGRPVVVSDLGAVPETVLAPPEVGEAERTGWRVPAGDAAALADAIAAALTLAPDEHAALAARARAHVAARFSLAAMRDATLRLYADLLARRKTPA